MLNTSGIQDNYASEFLLNIAKKRALRKKLIVQTSIQNPDGSYTVTWTKQQPFLAKGEMFFGNPRFYPVIFEGEIDQMKVMKAHENSANPS